MSEYNRLLNIIENLIETKMELKNKIDDLREENKELHKENKELQKQNDNLKKEKEQAYYYPYREEPPKSSRFTAPNI